MKKMIVVLIGAAALGAPAAHAQVTIDMTKVTCAEYLAMPDAQSRDFSAWMSGWYSQKGNDTTINLEGYARNVASVKSWCAANLKESVMAGLQRAAPTAPVRTGGPTEIDTSLITCRQFLDADADRKQLMQAWMAGFFSATKNLTTVDMRYVNRNEKVIGTYCNKNKNAKLMAAIQKNAR